MDQKILRGVRIMVRKYENGMVVFRPLSFSFIAALFLASSSPPLSRSSRSLTSGKFLGVMERAWSSQDTKGKNRAIWSSNQSLTFNNVFWCLDDWVKMLPRSNISRALSWLSKSSLTSNQFKFSWTKRWLTDRWMILIYLDGAPLMAVVHMRWHFHSNTH